MTKSLPPKPSLKHLRLEAKSLLKAHKAADASCCAILRNLHQFKDTPDDGVLKARIGLQEAQFALAKEYDAESWVALKARVGDAVASSEGERVLEDAVSEALHDEANRVLVSSLLSDLSPKGIAEKLNQFTKEAMGKHIEACHMLEISCGMAFGLTLMDGQRILLKVHGPGEPMTRLKSVHQITMSLHADGFPCPPALCEPLDIGRASVTFQAFIDDGTQRDAHLPEVRRLMAEGLERQIRLARGFAQSADLRRWGERPDGTLWPKPHNALFDFERSAEGAEYIDDIARRVIDVAESDEPMIAGHADWAVKHFRFVGDRILVVYDWDSLQLGTESQIVANAAVSFTFNDQSSQRVKYTDPAQAVAFVREYEEARGQPFTAQELASIAAAGTYSMAYRARCEHAINTRLDGSCRQILQSMTGEYYMSL